MLPQIPLADKRLHLSKQSFADEKDTIGYLLKLTEDIQSEEATIYSLAQQLVQHMREEGLNGGIEAFLHEYGLETKEGIAMMCLAEALLRIPDKATVDALILDTFEHTKWEKHLGKSESLFVNASSWGLLLTGKVVNLQGENALGIFGNAVARLGEPVIRQSLKTAMRLVGNQFVLGEDMSDALANSLEYTKKGFSISFDILGEGARTDEQAEHYATAYIDALDEIQNVSEIDKHNFSMSIKLSALHPRLHLNKREQLFAELLPRLKRILLKAKALDITVSIDAEEAFRLDINLEIFTALLLDADFAGWNGLGYVVQAYQKRAHLVIDYLRELAAETQRIIPIRLVKGAYWDSEIKWAQMAGLENYPVFTKKEHTDVSFLACAAKLFQQTTYFYPQFATHNARTAASIMRLAQKYHISHTTFEFQRLYGMGELLHQQLVGKHTCRIYAPVGKHRDLLAYLIRRLMENSANSSFVHLLMDASTPMPELLANPIEKTKLAFAEPNKIIPIPKHLYHFWQNSSGLDSAYLFHRVKLQEALQLYKDKHWQAKNPSQQITAASTKIMAPNSILNEVGQAAFARIEDVEKSVQIAKVGIAGWKNTEVETRAAILKTIADGFEENRDELLALLMREAGKHHADAISEIREAQDFCRYYAYEARKLFTTNLRPGPTGESNQLTLHSRGVVACISPWNFPLAIFTGQIVAALVTGNAVIAKPAEQTPLIADMAVQLMHQAGVPENALLLLLGDGEIGAALTKHYDISGVVFTGSVNVAKHIQLTLANRTGAIVPLIAETGGINAMVVDSSALLEQAVDDIILSAFGSAGQRCSALRLLYVQEEIADDLLHMLKGALQYLRVGDTLDFANDIGAVIDHDAKRILDKHIADLKQTATLIAAAPAPVSASHGYFVVPHIFELKSDADLTEEFFGPLLHVVRFKQKKLLDLPKRINARGFGLTFGIHSRIQNHIHYFTSHIQAGNIYVNRSMIGAVVGVQPFGGEGLSGTGPKAGGPHYLGRFVTERHLALNAAAIGGNISLLSQ